MRMKLIPQTSSLPHWTPFLEDTSRQSYSYLLKFDSNPKNPSWTTRSQLDQWFDALHPSHTTAWTDSYYKGEKLLRKTAWITLNPNCHCDYGYSDTWQTRTRDPQFQTILQEITALVVEATGCETLNSCNLNYYPQGGGVGWHADDEFLFDGRKRPTCIVSLSLCRGNHPNSPNTTTSGARRFLVKLQNNVSEEDTQNQYDSTTILQEVVLGHGDLLTMEGMFQNHYFHSVWPGDSKDHGDDPLTQGERINLTWRTIVQHLDGSEECRGKVCPLSSKAT